MRIPLVLLSLAYGLAQAQDSGPIQTRNHRALSLPFLRLLPGHGVLGRADREWSAGWAIANDVRKQPTGGPTEVEEDQETLRFAFRYREGLGNGSEWWIEAPILSRGGGILDPIIDGWHKNILRWSDPLRNDTPMGRSVVTVGSQTFGSAAGLGDVSLGYSKSLGRRYQLDLGLKFPTGDPGRLLGSGGLDIGIAVSGVIPINSRWRLYLQAGAVVQGKPSRLEGARGLVDQACVAFIYRQSARDTWVVQWQSEASALQTGVAASDAPHRLVTFGYRRRISSTQSLEGFFSEDRDLFRPGVPELANVGPDFTMGMRLVVRM
ncbi:MAG: DUF3187 family protein [Fimbriimonadaceae bacterium]